MEKSQHNDVGGRHLIAHQVTAHPKLPDLPRIKVAEPHAAAREINQPLWCLAQLVLNLASKNRVMDGNEIDEAIDVIARLG